MLDLFEMWALVEIIGLISLPLATTVFAHTPDRGWAWSKALGLAILAVCIWLPLMVLHFLTFDRFFVAAILLALFVLNAVSLPRTYRTIVDIIRSNMLYVIVTELVFLGMVFVLGYIRSYDPDIHSFEMFMDEGFLASILRSAHFPPHDMWYEGMSINYYYYMHYVVAMLAKLLGQPASIAFNTGISMLYGLSAVTLFGLTSNIVVWARHQKRAGLDIIASLETTDLEHSAPADAALETTDLEHSAPADAALETTDLEHSAPADAALETIDQPEPLHRQRRSMNWGIPFGLLTMALALVLGNMQSAISYFTRPQQNWYDWFGPSRVIKDTVNEFPAFSFLLSDFHAHTLTLAFTALAMGIAFNFLLARDSDGAHGIWLYGHGLRLPITLLSSAVVLGGLFVMNGWDLPTYLGLTVICIGIQQLLQHKNRISFRLLIDTCEAVIPLVILSYLIFLPFYRHYVSPAGGIGLVQPSTRSTLHDEFMIYGPFALIFITLLACYTFIRPHAHARLEPEEQERGSYISWTLIGLLCGLGFLLVGVAMNFINPPNATIFVALGLTVIGATLTLRHRENRGLAFVLLLGTVACALVTGCEVFFLRDAFVDQPRYNTVFKFYFQAWILLSVACGAGLYFIIDAMRSWHSRSRPLRIFQWSGRIVWSLCLIALLALGAVYPIVAPYYRVERYDPKTGMAGVYRSNSLDGMAYFRYDQNHLGDYEAIQWLNKNVPDNAVIVEGYYDQDYSEFGRVSSFTGLQTIMGWLGHEYQWRMGWLAQSDTNYEEFNRRASDVNTIYTSNDPTQVLNTMKRYNAQYLYVGLLEEARYNKSNLRRFQSYMQIVYQSDNVTIYKVK